MKVSEPPESKSNQQSETVSDLDLDDSQMEIDYFETKQCDKTLEDMMFPETEKVIIADLNEIQ